MKTLVERLSTPWPDNDVVNIVCHGHSVPAGYFKTPNVCTLDSYPHLLLTSLKSVYPFAIVNVIVTARGGETSPSGAARFVADVLSHRPALVTLDYALNDRSLGLDAARSAWISMIDDAREAGAEVALLTPTPDLTAQLDNPTDAIYQHAEQVRELALQHQTALVDSAAAFQRWVADGGRLEDLMAQHNHPNRRGHELVARALMGIAALAPLCASPHLAR